MNFRRIKRLKTAMAGSFDGVLLNNPADIFYYTGYWPSTGCFLLIAEQPVLFVHRIETGAERLACEVVIIKKTKDVEGRLSGKIGFDETKLTVADYMELRRAKLTPASQLIASIRTIKESEEIEAIRTSQRVVRRCWPKEFIGRSEADIARSVIMAIIKEGGRPAFEPIIAGGPNGWYIHHSPVGRKIRATDLVIVDIGVRFNHYCSDRTRTFCVRQGKKEKEIIERVADIQAQLIDMLVDGIPTQTIDAEYARLLEKAGHKPLHGWGHSIGLEPHEPVGDMIKAGMTLTVEPGIYIKGFGGCRIEDIVLVKKNKAKII